MANHPHHPSPRQLLGVDSLHDLELQLKEFSRSVPGVAVAVPDEICNRTLSVLRMLAIEGVNTTVPVVVPGSDGSINLEWNHLGHEVEILIAPQEPLAEAYIFDEATGFERRSPINGSVDPATINALSWFAKAP